MSRRGGASGARPSNAKPPGSGHAPSAPAPSAKAATFGADAISGPESFAAAFDVSRETLVKFVTYRDELIRWQKAINLVAPRTLDQIWLRHFADSAQVLRLAPPEARRFVDIGSGAGFPGLVLAILLAESNPAARVTLVESDQRKAAFLRDVARTVDIPVEVLSTRIEESATVAQVAGADVISARALAPLPRLCGWLAPLFGPATVALLLKGRDWQAEIEAARAHFVFEADSTPSLTDAGSQIIALRRLVTKKEGEQ